MTKGSAATDEIERFADVLLEGAREGVVDTHRLPASLDRSDGLSVQIALLRRWRELDPAEPAGWKVGLTSGPLRDRMGNGYRPFGHILRSRSFESGAAIELARFRPAGIEPELAFEIAQPLRGPDLDTTTVAAAVRGVRPAFELNQHRLPRPIDDGLLIADNLTQWGIVCGPICEWPGDIGAVAVVMACDGVTVAQAGPGFSIDDPMLAIARLCAELDSHGIGLEPGQRVITGAFCKAPVECPGVWTAQFSGIGEVVCHVV